MSGLNTAQLTAFVSTNKLNVAQASLALRAAGVSREQRIQILTNAGLITSNGALTVSLKSVTAALLAQAKAWAATPMGMATIAAAAIFAIVKAVDYFSSASERAAEELANLESEFEELQNKITDASNEFKTLRSSAETVIPRFAELAQGVDAFGNNVSLTDEEYKEFLSLNNQIAEMFPEINMGMNSNGNAMLALSYTADTLADSLWGVVEAERATTNKEISDTMPDVISNIEDTVGLYKDKIADLSSIQAKYFDTYVDFKNQVLKTKFSSNEAKEIANIAKELGINYKMDLKRGDRRTTYYQVEWDYSSLDDDEFLKELETNFNAAMQKYDKLIDNNYRIKDAKWKQLNPVVSSWLQTDFMYQELDSSMQGIAQTMVSGLDFSSLGLKTSEQVQEYVTSYIVEPLFSATPEVEAAFANIANWKQLLKDGDISSDQFSEYVTDTFNSLIENMDPDAVDEFKKIFVSSFGQAGIAGNDFSTVLDNLIVEWSDFSNATGIASDQFSTFNAVSEKLIASKENIDTLSDAMSKLANGSLEVWDVVDLIKKFPELTEYVDFAADGFGNLEAGLRALSTKQVKDFIDEMQNLKETSNLSDEQIEQIDTLCESLSDLSADSVRNLSNEYGILADQIRAATVAQTDLEKKLAEDDYDAGYQDRVEAFANFQKVVDAGLYGSKKYSAYKEYFGISDMDIDSVKQWLKDNDKYFSEGSEGIYEFLKTVEDLNTEYHAFKDVADFDSSTKKFTYDINQLDKFAEALGWNEEMLQDFIGAYRMYCDADEYDSRTIEETMSELSNAGEIFSIGQKDVSPTFASLSSLMEYTGLSEEGVYSLVDSMNELRKQQNLLDITLIGRDVDSVTQWTIQRWKELGGTAEDICGLIIQLAEEGVNISPHLSVTDESGKQTDIDKMLYEAGFEDHKEYTVEIDMVIDGEEEGEIHFNATQGQLEQILGENWQVKITSNTVDAETGISAIETLIGELPENTDIYFGSDTYDAVRDIGDLKRLIESVEGNKTISFSLIPFGHLAFGSLDANAKGTSRARRGPSLLGDEYSPSGAPKPELVVSGDRAYIAGMNGPEIGYLNDGDIVYTADETKRILRGNTLHKSFQAHAGGTIVDWVGFSGGRYSHSGKGPSDGKSDDENWFERQYKDHNHWIEMDKERMSDYLDWLDDAYKRAYDEGIIDIDEYYKYEEEILKKTQDLFKDHLNDIDHEISLLEDNAGSSDEIINLTLQAIVDIEKELAAARAAGLDENGDYIQYLEQQWADYSQTVIDMREDAESEIKSSIDDLVEYRIDMLKQEIEDQKDALNEKLDDLQEFYDKQREMLQDKYDEEKYLEEQNEKRKSVSDIREELAMLEFDNSAWAQKRKLELQEELAEAEKELESFEKDHALDEALDMLDKQQEAQEAEIQAQIDALDEKLNDPHALFNQALADITNNTEALYKEFIAYNRKHGSGNDKDIADMWEEAYKADLEYQDTHNGEHLDGIAIGNYTGYVIPDAVDPPQPDPAQQAPAPEQDETVEPEKTYPYGRASDTSGTIKVGSNGENVKAIQYALNELGFGNAGTKECHGMFGPDTKRAVQAFQRAMGVSADGIVGNDTRAKFKAQGYALGTKSATYGIHEVEEFGTEYIFESPSDGSRYRMFHGGEKVLNADATNFLYDFATSGGGVLMKMLSDLFGLSNFGNISKPVQAIEIHSGDIIVHGNANERTVSEIRRAQRENLEFVIKEFNQLNK